jgi:hypothetical protein
VHYLKSLLERKALSISDYFDPDPNGSYIDALDEARKGRTSNQTRQALRSAIGEPKKKIQNWERMQRKKWSSLFVEKNSLPNDWQEFYPLLLQERYFNQVLYGMVEACELSNRFHREDIMKLDHKSLPALSIGIEVYIALQFLIDSQSKGTGKPDRGDLPDMQHAFYVGLCDYFVTDDSRVWHILSDLVDAKGAKIIGCGDFYQNLAQPQ